MLNLVGAIAVENGQWKEAEQIYRDLVHRNPANHFYLEQLEKCLGLDDIDSRLKFYSQLQEEYPRSHVIRRLPLTFTTGQLVWGQSTTGGQCIVTSRCHIPKSLGHFPAPLTQ